MADPVPEGVDPEQWALSIRLGALEDAILRVVGEADPEIPQNWRTVILADALSHRELFASDWCVACKLSHADPLQQLCPDHDKGGDLADAARRYLYARVGALILEDLPGPERRLRIVKP
jgi:hypothetical protein